jgi:hypothetical protein
VFQIQSHHVIKHIWLFFVSDYVAWKGRFAAFDFAAYEHMMNYIIAQVMGQNPPLPDPWDIDIDVDGMQHILSV